MPETITHTPDEIYSWVLAYQAGDNHAAMETIHAFSSFTEGFYLLLRGNLLRATAASRLTYSHRIFLSTFIRHGGHACSLKSRKPSAAAYLAAERALTSISIQLRPIDEEDLRHDILEIFLGTLRRYRSRDEQNYVLPYIQKSFAYALARRIQALIKDPLVNLASDKILSIEWLNEAYDRKGPGHGRMVSHQEITKHLTVSEEVARQEADEDELGNAWLRGDYCDEQFTQLTYPERKILKQFYHLEMTDAQIAAHMGVSYNTAIRRRHHIEAKLRGEYTPPACQYCTVQIPKAPVGRQPRQCSVCREHRRLERQANRRRL